MRVATNMLYDTSSYHLGRLTTDLKTANDVVATQKQINTLSDDPTGLISVLDLKASIQSVEQMNSNIAMGKTWLNSVETALSSAGDLVSDAKLLCSQAINGSMNSSQRADAVEQVDAIFNQMLMLSNEQVGGRYIFAGSRTDLKPFEVQTDADGNPVDVIYQGDDNPFSIKTGKDFQLDVGRDGAAVFENNVIEINETNNKIDFREYSPDHYLLPSRELTATLPSGTYTPEALAQAVENAMTNTSASEDGYGLTYEARYDEDAGKFTIQDDGTVDNAHVELLWKTGSHAGSSEKALESDVDVIDFSVNELNNQFEFYENVGGTLNGPLSVTIPEMDYEDGESLAYAVEGQMNDISADGHYQVEYNDVTQRIVVRPGPTSEVEQLQIMWNSQPDINTAGTLLGFTQDDYYDAGDEGMHGMGTSIGADLGFEAMDIRDAVVSDKTIEVPVVITTGVNDTIDFTEDNGLGFGPVDRTATIVPSLASYTTDDELEILATEIETAMQNASAAGSKPYEIDYSVTYDASSQRFTIQEKNHTASDTTDEYDLKALQIHWSSDPSGTGAGEALGFTEDSGYTPPTSDNETQWGLFDTLIDLREALAADDTDGLSRAMSGLDFHYEKINGIVSDTGMKYNNLEMKESIYADLKLSYTERRSSIEDVDMVESVMNLQSVELAYEASLNSTSKILQLSLVDFIR